MKTFKRITSNFHLYVICAVLSFFLWGWIFGMVNDTTAFKKVSVYIDCDSCRDMELRLELEKEPPEGIKLIPVHTLDYVVFDETTMFQGDILVLRESQFPNYKDALTPLAGAESRFEGCQLLEDQGAVYGLKVYDAATGTGILADYVVFQNPGEKPEDFYLFFFKQSRHLGAINGSRDEAAFQVARTLMNFQ